MRKARIAGLSRSTRLLAASGAIAGAYWVFMSPYSQMLGPFPYRAKTTERLVALTFDDGPNEPYTSALADYLEQEGIRATFFQVGHAVRRDTDTTLRLMRAGHVVGHHANTHRFTRYLRASTLRDELDAASNVFGEHGVEPALYRPPWLMRIPALFPLLQARGMLAVSGVFCHPLEVLQPSPRRLAHRAASRTRPGTILIFHDGVDGRGGKRQATLEAIKLLVPELRTRGFEFRTVDELLGVPAYRTPRASDAGDLTSSRTPGAPVAHEGDLSALDVEFGDE